MNIEYDNIYANITAENSSEFQALARISRNFTVLAPGAFHTRKYQLYRKSKGKLGWSGKVSMFIDGQLLTGLLPKFIAECAKLGRFNFKLIDKRGIPRVSSVTLPKKVAGNTLRDFQTKALKQVTTASFNKSFWPRGIVQHPTGAGKSTLISALVQTFTVPTIIMVHREHLISQMSNVLSADSIPFGLFGAGTHDLSKPVTLATIQTLYSRNETIPSEFKNSVQQIIIDECHLAAADLTRGNTFVRMCAEFPSAYLRWGFTATPFMRDKYSDWLLEGVAGEVLVKETARDLIDAGYLAEPKITMIEMMGQRCKNKWPLCYEINVVLNEKRNRRIVEEAEKISKPCLILVDQIAHGTIIQKYAKELGKNYPLLQGETEIEVRHSYIEASKKGMLDVMIATTIFDEGLDLPNLGGIILAGAKKSSIKCLQRVGRGMRISPGKTSVDVVDFFDTTPRLLRDHSTRRKDTWLSEKLSVKMLPSR